MIVKVGDAAGPGFAPAAGDQGQAASTGPSGSGEGVRPSQVSKEKRGDPVGQGGGARESGRLSWGGFRGFRFAPEVVIPGNCPLFQEPPFLQATAQDASGE
jgi:hypothetical protein